MRTVDVLIVGAGQAGLAAGYWLRNSGLDFLLVDGASRVGDSWRQRWDSLALFTPARYSSLPGLTMLGEPDRYPTKDEVADYLDAYARHFELPVRLEDAVQRLERVDETFVATLSSGMQVRAHSIVLATGAFQLPSVPDLARCPGYAQLTPNSYRNAAMLPDGTVLIVGDGATGRQIAVDLVTTHRVLLATGRRRRVSPDRVLGKSIFWWLDRLGLLRAHRDSFIGRLLRERDPFPGRHLALSRLSAAGVVTKPRLSSLAHDRAIFADNSTELISTVIWATGYREDNRWIAVDGALDATDQIIESEGVSPIEGLYYVGRNWQRNRGSALLFGVGEDARLIVDRIQSSRPARIAAQGRAASPIRLLGNGTS